MPRRSVVGPGVEGDRLVVERCPVDIASELRALAANLWWTWNPNTIAVFREIDPALWREVNHSPAAFLAQIPSDQLEARAEELALKARINYAFHRLQEYLERRQSWGDVYSGPLRANPVAYFCAEFGLHESLPIYSGGLGILAGDHLKSASDLGIPIVGVGLFYAQGYFTQRLDATGWQNESYFEAEIDHLPIQRVQDPKGEPVHVQVETRSGAIRVGLWRASVGRATLVLLDSDVEGNSPADRELTGRLYGGDADLRIRQELILGVGGVRALTALGIGPGALHLNEGHCAFAPLETAREFMESDAVSFADALRRVTMRTVFTTHTPVEAGHDRFDGGLVEHVLGPLRERLGLSPEEFLALGRAHPENRQEPFCMTVLGLRAARYANGVSAHHGQVARRMWQGLWPGRSEFDVPIRHVTNGVHVASWLAPPVRQLYDRYLGPEWERHMGSPETWRPIDAIEDGELWEAHQITKARLVSYVQRQVCLHESQRGGDGTVCDLTTQRLDPAALTLGFARRFATYKRADLILMDDARLERLVSNAERPVQIIFAGKAHPRDDPGKRLIQRIFGMARDPRFLGRVVFIEDYDINVARHLIQGVDLWLNTPRRPQEASGTSGMKALFNGVLNLSILDGWWAEAYDGSNGFAIGSGGEHSSAEEQGRRDAEDLYAVLEDSVVPLYYERDARGVPRGWVARAKNAIRSLAWRFSANRMAMEYARHCYLPLVGAAPLDGDCRT